MIATDVRAKAGINKVVADRLEELAHLLEQQEANPFRARAYRAAATTVRALTRSVADILESEGLEGLDRLPTIGPAIAHAIRQLVISGRLPMLERIRGESDPIQLLASIPGVGQTLAKRLHSDLAIDTLEELEIAAHDGTLSRAGGFGTKRIAAIRQALAYRLGRARQSAPRRTELPSVAEILDVDNEYRTRAAAGTLPRIAPRRFNPDRRAWLPILHTQRGDRSYTALYSNTARAHELGKTNDWVVLYYDGKSGERQCTVITAGGGLLKGRRMVPQREEECVAHYRDSAHNSVARVAVRHAPFE